MSGPEQATVRGEVDAVLAEWGWCLDHGELEGLLDVFTEDARLAPEPGVVLRGRDEIRRRYANRTGPRTTRHLYSGLRLEVVDDARVRATSVWVTYAANAAAPVAEVPAYQVAEFHDVLTRGEDHRWRIAERTIVSVLRDPARAPVPS